MFCYSIKDIFSHTAQLHQSSVLAWKWAMDLLCTLTPWAWVGFLHRWLIYDGIKLLFTCGINNPHFVLSSSSYFFVFNLNTDSDLWSPSWNDKRHHKWTQSDGALDWKTHSQRLCSVHRWYISCIFTCHFQGLDYKCIFPQAYYTELLISKGRTESWCRDSATDQELFRYRLGTTAAHCAVFR